DAEGVARGVDGAERVQTGGQYAAADRHTADRVGRQTGGRVIDVGETAAGHAGDREGAVVAAGVPAPDGDPAGGDGLDRDRLAHREGRVGIGRDGDRGRPGTRRLRRALDGHRLHEGRLDRERGHAAAVQGDGGTDRQRIVEELDRAGRGAA